MSIGRGILGNERAIGRIRVWQDSTGKLRAYYNADGEPVDADADGVQIWLADGSVVATSDFDLNHNEIANLNGFNFGGSSNVAFVSTYAELKAACEDANKPLVYVIANITVSATIAPTTYTHVTGVNNIEFDWSGAAGGYIFRNDGADYVTFENLHYVKTGNAYFYLPYNSDDWTWKDCLFDAGLGTGDPLGTRFSFYRCHFDCEAGRHQELLYVDCTFSDVLRLRKLTKARLRGCNFDASGYLEISGHSTYPTDRNIIIEATTWDTAADRCIYLALISGTATFKNIKLMNCILEPANNTKPCVEVQNTADLTVEDFQSNHCTFKDAASGFLIPNGTQNRFRFNNGQYESVTTWYNYTGGTQNDFVYTMDGI